jgi:hypothetical protein
MTTIMYIKRSKEWRDRHFIETGEMLKRDHNVVINFQEFSQEARKAYLYLRDQQKAKVDQENTDVSNN